MIEIRSKAMLSGLVLVFVSLPLLSNTVAAKAAVPPIPDALEVQKLAKRQDVQALQEFLQRYQRAYEADQGAERALIQAHWA